jgi:copper homeostasis protein (lipoprotein)
MSLQAWLLAILSIGAATQSPHTLSAQSTTTPKQDSATAKSPMQLVGQYRGVLPCADCPGIDTTLSLLANSPNDVAHARYVLKSSYQERNNTFTETGTWTIVHGTPDNPAATVYQLKPENGGQPTNFLRVSDNEILQLDSERRRVDSKLNFSLKKTTNRASPVPPPAALNTPAVSKQ